MGKPTLEQKFIARSEFTQLGLEIKAEVFLPSDKEEIRRIPNYIIAGKGVGRYILQRTIPISVLEEICENSAVYKIIDYYEVKE